MNQIARTGSASGIEQGSALPQSENPSDLRGYLNTNIIPSLNTETDSVDRQILQYLQRHYSAVENRSCAASILPVWHGKLEPGQPMKISSYTDDENGKVLLNTARCHLWKELDGSSGKEWSIWFV